MTKSHHGGNMSLIGEVGFCHRHIYDDDDDADDDDDEKQRPATPKMVT